MTAPGAYAIRDALRRGRSGVNDDVESWAQNRLLPDLKASISGASPSSPGQPPGVDTGRLRETYTFKVEEKTDTVIVLKVYSPLDYSVYLEFGTRYMAPRPHLRPCMVRNYVTLRQAVADGIVRRERGA